MAEPRYRYGGDSAIGALLLPERREILRDEQNQLIGYDDRGQAIVQTLPAQYGESEVDFSYSPVVRGAEKTLSFIRDAFSGDPERVGSAADRAETAIRGVMGGLTDYASSQYQAGMAGGTTYDPETRQITEFDPTAVLLSNAPAGIQAVRNAPPNTMTLGAAGGRMNPELIEVGSASFNLRKRALSGDESAISELMQIDGLDRDNVLRRAQNAVTKAENDFQAMGGRTAEEYRKSIYGDKTKEEFLEEGNRERFGEIEAVSSNDYRGDHQPPNREYGAPLNDLTSMIPEDIYSPAGVRLYGLGNPAVDSEAFEALRAARGNPRAEVSIYRAVPQDVDVINAGDWVTTSRAYADMHGENALGGNYRVLEQKARAGDLQSEGYPYEFGFNPLDMSQGARMQRAQDLGYDIDNPIYHSTNSSFDSFEIPEDRFLKYGKGVYATPSPNYSDRYIRQNRDLESAYKEGANVMPMYARGKIGTEQDWEAARQEMLAEGVNPEGYNPMQEEIKRRLQEKGFDGLNMFGNEIIIYDPKNLRSINAEFDPAKADSADLLSSRQSERQMSALRGIA